MARRVNTGRNLDDVVAQTMDDVQNLNSQIRALLQTMDAVENIECAITMSIAEPAACSKQNDEGPKTKMQWHDTQVSKMQRKGKTVPAEGDISASRRDHVSVEEDNYLCGFDIMEMCVKEKIDKYVPVSESAYFVPVLERCVFGVTLLNAAMTVLKKPTITLSVLDSSNSGDKNSQSPRKTGCRCILYDVQVNLNEVDLDRVGATKIEQGLVAQDSFNNYLDLSEQVQPGCEVSVTATFSLPTQMLSQSNFTLLLSVYLHGKELWIREVPITADRFSAASIDDVFKKHHSSVISAIGKEYEIFKMERLLSRSETSPYKSLERFLMPMGYEKIQSIRTAPDTTIEVYTTHQPSMLWGTCFKIEKCSRKLSTLRCLVTSRTREQMLYLLTQFKNWLRVERLKEKKQGISTQIVVSSVNPRSNSSVCEKLQAEADLIKNFQNVKSVFKKEKESGRATKRRADTHNDVGSIDSAWIHEYSIYVERTDLAFVNRI